MTARFLVLWGEPTDIDAFEAHYRDVHIPLANRMARLRSYTVSTGVSPIRGDEKPYRVGELEWDTLEDLRQDFRSPEGEATARDVEVLSQWSPGVRSIIYEARETR
jgi:uncharacterized protein (TIGR02118 family)